MNASVARHCVLAVPFLTVFFLTCHSTRAQDKTVSAGKIRELQEKRLAVLVKIHESYLNRLKAGTPLMASEFHQAQADLFGARLDLAETKQDRIKVCEEALKDAEAWEQIVAKWVQAGFREITVSDGLKAQAFILEIQIALEKTKAVK